MFEEPGFSNEPQTQYHRVTDKFFEELEEAPDWPGTGKMRVIVAFFPVPEDGETQLGNLSALGYEEPARIAQDIGGLFTHMMNDLGFHVEFIGPGGAGTSPN